MSMIFAELPQPTVEMVFVIQEKHVHHVLEIVEHALQEAEAVVAEEAEALLQPVQKTGHVLIGLNALQKGPKQEAALIKMLVEHMIMSQNQHNLALIYLH